MRFCDDDHKTFYQTWVAAGGSWSAESSLLTDSSEEPATPSHGLSLYSVLYLALYIWGMGSCRVTQGCKGFGLYFELGATTCGLDCKGGENLVHKSSRLPGISLRLNPEPEVSQSVALEARG